MTAACRNFAEPVRAVLRFVVAAILIISWSQQLAYAAGDDKRVAAQAAFAEAERLRTQGGTMLEAALAKYERALVLWRDVGERTRVAGTLNAMALAYEAAGKPERALACFDESLALAHAERDGRGEAGICVRRGRLLVHLKREHEALDGFERAVLLYGAARDRVGEAAACVEVRKLCEQIDAPLLAAEAQAHARAALASREVLYVDNIHERAVARVPARYPTSTGVYVGVVTLDVLVAEDGEVVFVVPVDGPPKLYEPAVTAVRQWRFAPTLHEGVAVQVRGQLVFRFNKKIGRSNMTQFRSPPADTTRSSGVPDS